MARSNADGVFDTLRADILGGVYQPGTRLKFADLSERYGASMSVIREGLSRLAEQGLVTSEPNVGFQVASLSIDELHDLTWTRIQLESLALRRAIEVGDLDWESSLIAAHHRLDRTPMITDGPPRRVSDDWEAAHVEFHRALIAGCGSARLIGIIDNLRSCAELHRRWSGAWDEDRDVGAEHAAIARIAIDRDAETAVTALADHYRKTLAIVLEHPDREPAR